MSASSLEIAVTAAEFHTSGLKNHDWGGKHLVFVLGIFFDDTNS
jgi:hypothetical protein